MRMPYCGMSEAERGYCCVPTLVPGRRLHERFALAGGERRVTRPVGRLRRPWRDQGPRCVGQPARRGDRNIRVARLSVSHAVLKSVELRGIELLRAWRAGVLTALWLTPVLALRDAGLVGSGWPRPMVLLVDGAAGCSAACPGHGARAALAAARCALDGRTDPVPPAVRGFGSIGPTGRLTGRNVCLDLARDSVRDAEAFVQALLTRPRGLRREL